MTAIAFLVFAPHVEVAAVRPIGKLFPRCDLAPQASVVPAVATSRARGIHAKTPIRTQCEWPLHIPVMCLRVFNKFRAIASQVPAPGAVTSPAHRAECVIKRLIKNAFSRIIHLVRCGRAQRRLVGVRGPRRSIAPLIPPKAIP
ncbi:hypothetical protein [Xanthomonas sacchari]|uniref:hypothetical protein n=1 Tax=Xanthomonas sacchari TaxID=56458 RepID=UPI0012E029EE|nr:hypothetical protein [Xanthomonas sacchari]